MGKCNYKIHVLGCRGSRTCSGPQFLEFGTATSCYILKSDKYALVIDTGTGFYNAKEILSDCEVIDIYFTHVHYDHILGLLDSSVLPSNALINLYGGFVNWAGKNTIDDFYRAPFWPIQPNLGKLNIIVPDGIKHEIHNGIVVESLVSNHPNYANILKLFIEDKTIIVMFDCEDPYFMPIEKARNADLILFDGMYTDEEYDKHIGWGHATYQCGCRFAKETNIKELIVCHHEPNRSDEDLRKFEKIAKTIYEKTRFAREGDIYEI